MTRYAWLKEFPAAITVCDSDGMILEMNDKAAKTFESDGGYALIGANLLDCHPQPVRQKLEAMLSLEILFKLPHFIWLHSANLTTYPFQQHCVL